MTPALQVKKGVQLFSGRPCPPGKELHPLFHGIVWATLLGLFIVCHGCHGDEDNELGLTPGVRAQRPAQIETTAKNTIQER